MTTHRLSALILVSLVAMRGELGAQSLSSGGTPCAGLTALTIPNVRIVAATPVPAGPFVAPDAKTPVTVPAFCRVQGVASPVADSEIKFEVWMPAGQAWTGRFQGIGIGGYAGNISYQGLVAALARGSAAMSNDLGHTGGDLEFGLGHPEKVVDWAHRAMHVTTEAGKLIVRNHLARFPDYSYFVGCSSGGHQAMSEVQRYPEDYDGVLAGDPAFDRVNQTFAYLAAWLATHDAAGKPLIASSKLPLLTKGAVAACDANDGLVDGLIDDPRSCQFNPDTLVCRGDDAANCLTRTEADSARKVYAGLRSPETGALIYPGWLPGSEGFGAPASQSWRQMILDPPSPMRVEVLSYFLFNNPKWDWRTVDFDRDVRAARETIGFMSAVDPDLSRFKNRGGKLVMYSGWADPLLPGSDITNYYDRVTSVMGAPQDFARLFMVPGMGHCGGGPGPDTFDALTPLEAWVENGVPPDRLIASTSGSKTPPRTRPLCAYPLVARWKKTGSSDDAANFACVAPGGPAR